MRTRPVTVGIDGSPDSARALMWASEYARRYEAPLEALMSWEAPPVSGHPVTFEQEYSALEEHTRRLLRETVRKTLGDDAGVVERLERGHPVATLVTASERSQLLVVGTRGLGSFQGLLLGSVSQHCVVHSKCPVVVIPQVEVKKP